MYVMLFYLDNIKHCVKHIFLISHNKVFVQIYKVKFTLLYLLT